MGRKEREEERKVGEKVSGCIAENEKTKLSAVLPYVGRKTKSWRG